MLYTRFEISYDDWKFFLRHLSTENAIRTLSWIDAELIEEEDGWVVCSASQITIRKWVLALTGEDRIHLSLRTELWQTFIPSDDDDDDDTDDDGEEVPPVLIAKLQLIAA